MTAAITIPNHLLATNFAAQRNRTLIYDEEISLYWTYDDSRRVWSVYNPERMEEEIGDYCEVNAPSNRLTTSVYDDVRKQLRRKVRHFRRLKETHIAFNDCLFNPITFETIPLPPTIEELREIVANDPKFRPEKDTKYRDIYLENVATLHIDAEYSRLHEAKMPLFLKYLYESCANRETNTTDLGMVRLVQEIIGYFLTFVNANKCFEVYGNGGTGKGVLLEIIRRLVSEERCLSHSIGDMTTKDFVADSLIGKTANILDETKAGEKIDIARLKLIVDGKPLTTRRLYGSSFAFRPQIKIIWSTQEHLQTGAYDNSINRRFIHLVFDNICPKENAVIDLHERIFENGELPAIIHWGLQGLRRLQDNRFVFSETMKTAEVVDEFRTMNSSVLDYISQTWVRVEGNKVSFKSVYDDYNKWCKEGNRKPVSANRFSREARESLGLPKSIRIGGTVTKGFEIARIEDTHPITLL